MTFLAFYVSLLLPTALVLSLFWTEAVSKLLYYTSDPIPVLGFIPPFVYEGGYGDHYIAAKIVVYVVWSAFVAVLFGLPAVLTLLVLREGHNKGR